MPKDDLQHYWMLYSMQGEGKHFDKCITIFLENNRKCLLDCDNEALTAGISGPITVGVDSGPHLFNLPDGFLIAISRSFRRYMDIITNKADLNETDVQHIINLTKVLIVLARNADNLSQLASSSSVNDCVAIASSVLRKEFQTAHGNLQKWTDYFVRVTFHLVRVLYDPSSLWIRTLKKTEPNDDFAPSSPPPVQSCVVSLISKFIAQGEEFRRPWLTVLALHALGSLLAGSRTNGVAVTSEGLIQHLFQLLMPSTEDSDEETVDLVLRCITLMVYTLLEASPDERNLDVSTLFSTFLQTLRSLPGSKENSKRIKLKMLVCIQDMSHYVDRSTLQVIFIGVGIFEQLVQIIQQAADVVASRDGIRLAVSSIKVLASMLRNSTHSKNLFVERIGYRMFFDVLTTITDANVEFIEALLELVVESSEKRVDVLVVANPAAAVMLLNYAAVLKSSDLQLLIVSRIHILVAKKMRSRIQCSSYGILEAVLTVLGTSVNIRQDVADQLIRLFETIASHSIDPIELRMLFRLLAEPSDDAGSSTYKARLIQSISVIADSANNKNPVRYFDIQGDNDGIVVPATRNKWPGPGFSFHAWVCLDDRPLMTTVSAENSFVRRILYSVLNSQGLGFEAFFTYECVLVVAVSNKKDYIALSLTDHGLHDCKWHCITIVHAPARRPFGSSTLSLYLDGRLVHATAMKLPPLSEPFTFLRIGSSPVRATKPSVNTAQRNFVYPDTLPVAPMSPKLPAHELITVQQGSQDHIFGVPVSLKGQLNSVCVFSDAVLPSEAKELFDGGPNIVFRPESVAGDLASRLFLYYHSNGCQGNQCADLSPSREHDGTFSGNLSTAWNMSASLACVGGFACLLPLLEHANTSLPRSQDGSDRLMNSSRETAEKDDDSSCAVDSGVSDWVVVQSSVQSRQSDRSSVAGFIHLLRKLITYSLEMQEDVTQSSVLAVIGLLLSKIESQLLDVDVLFALESLVEAAQGSLVWISLLTDVYQSLLFNFRIWVKAEFTVRLGHLQYVRKLIKDDKKSFRKKFGVQLFLDTLRIYSTKTSAAAATLTEDEGDMLRKHTIGVIQEFVCQNITHYEIAALINFLLASSCEKTVEDLLQMLLTVLESPNKSDQIYLLFFEPHAADSLYYLLLKSRLSANIKDKVVQLFSHLLKSGKVYDKSKTRLRLLDVGIGGMLLMMPGDLPLEFTRLYLEQYLANNLGVYHPSKFSCVLALFNKLQNAPVMVKLDFARKLLYALYMKQGATAQIAAQPGWYHSLTNLFVEAPMAVTPEAEKTRGSSVSDLIDLQSPEEDSISFNEAVRDRMAGGDYWASRSVEDDTKSETESYMSREAADQPDFIDARKQRTRMLSSSNVGRNSLGLNEPDSPSFRRNIAGEELVLATGSFTFLDDTLTHTSSKPETAQDDLCNVTLNILSTVLWQGIDGSSVTAWGKRAEVIVSLDMIALGNYMYRRPEELKRRLYEAAVQVVTSDVRKEPMKTSNSENAELVIRFVHDFITAPDLHVNIGTKLSEKLLEDLSTLFDTIKVWEADTSSGWSETLQMAMDIWLTVTRCPEMHYCSIVIPKLHYLIQHRLSCSRREVCYILSALNEALFMAIDMSNQEHISFIVPVLRLILEKWGATLSSARYLPNIPALSVSPQTWPIIQKYFRSPEWGNFVGNHVTPLSRDYVHAVCKIRKERMGEFWNEAQDAAMSQLHKRNKAFGESKLRFTQEYIEPVKRKVQDENYRFGCALQETKAEIARITRKWEELKRYLFRERGPWFAGGKLETMSLRMSQYENFFRMRPKLSENFHFDLHTAAAQLRDYTSPQYHPEDDQLVHIVVAKEAKVDHVVEDFTFDEEVEPVPTSRAPSAESQELEQKEKMVLQELCDLVTITELVQGRFELTTQRIKFHAMNPTFDANTSESYDIEVPLSSLREIHPRRYNLRRSAMEFFLVDQTNFLINFKIKTRNEIYRKIISLKPTSLTFFKSTNPSSLLRASNLTQRWVQREISNFEYLMALNTIAGRTYNDLSQYPVFPWVLRDYKSEELDLENPKTFRDFTRPMGVQNPKSVSEVKNKFDNFEDPTGTIEPFHYGQHYSNPASVIHYLLRVEPFTTMHIQLQSGRFDVADRQFHSIASTWELLWNNPNDVKELIPEFFYLPEFLVNLNGFDLGRLQQSRDRVNDVHLPKWAASPEEFIYQHRRALESDHVSAHLHEWIDLIFGYKQQGPEAVEALNVFYYCTYEGAVDLDAIQDPVERQATEGMINNFGQTPTQLLKEPHPRRLTFDEAMRKYSAVEGRSLNVFQHTKYLKAFLVEANVEGDALVCVALPRSAMRAASNQGVKSDLITLGMSGSIGIHSWTPFDRSSAKNMTFERDPAMSNARFARSIAGPFHPSLSVTSNLFAMTADCRLLFFCGNWDNSLRVYNFAKGKITAQVIRHRDLITCVALDNIGLTLITGSRDTTCLIWEVTQQAGVPLGINGKPLQTLYGHTSEVTTVAISVELDMTVSGAADGAIIVHTVKNGSYVRTLNPIRAIPASPRNRVNKVVITYDGKICAACYFPECRLGKHSVDLYSVNGKHLYTAPMMGFVNALTTSEDFVITGDADGRLEIREWFELKQVYSMQVSGSVTSLTVSRQSSHILAGLQDGKLIIVTVAPNIMDVVDR